MPERYRYRRWPLAAMAPLFRLPITSEPHDIDRSVVEPAGDMTMTAISSLTFVVTLLIIIAACGCYNSENDDEADDENKKEASGNDPKEDPAISHENSLCEQSAATFALNWYRAVNSILKDEPNVVSSPYAVQTAFALWYLGLSEGLQEKMVDVLFPESVAQGLDVAALLGKMNSATKWWRKQSIHLANRIYAPRNYHYQTDYRQQISSLFGGYQFLQVDFLSNEATLAESINSWTRTVTKKRINHMVNKYMLCQQQQTGLLLISALFVDAKLNLQHAFERSFTHFGQKFFGARNPCDYLRQRQQLNYFENEKCEILRLPYTGEKAMGLYFLLPRKPDGLNELEASLTAKDLLDLLRACRGTTKDVEVRLPKLLLRTELQKEALLAALDKMGCPTDVFYRRQLHNEEAGCHFSKMVCAPTTLTDQDEVIQAALTRRLWIAQMIHKVVFELKDTVGDSDSLNSVSVSTGSLSLSYSIKSTKDDSVKSKKDESVVKSTKDDSVVLFNADHPFMFILAIEEPTIPIVIWTFLWSLECC